MSSIVCTVVACLAFFTSPTFAFAQTNQEQESHQEAYQETEEEQKYHATKRGQKEHGSAHDKDYHVDEKGRSMRVAFPLYDRIAFGLSFAWADDAQRRSAAKPEFYIKTRQSWRLNFDEEEVWWHIRHEFLPIKAWNTLDDAWHFDAKLVDSSYLRHDGHAVIVIPAFAALNIPAPFDIAVDYRILHAKVELDAQNNWHVGYIQPIELAFLLDFLRDASYRTRFAVGVAGYYELEQGGQSEQKIWKHSVAPMTGAKVLFGWDHAQGLASAYTEVVCAAELSFEAEQSGGWSMPCKAKLLAEWTPLAVNDVPISIPLEVELQKTAQVPINYTILLGILAAF